VVAIATGVVAIVMGNVTIIITIVCQRKNKEI
jgi:hypothetical protein